MRTTTLAVTVLLALSMVESPRPAQDTPQPGPPVNESTGRIDAGLAWLKDHQNAEGYWSFATFGADSARKDAKRTGNLEWVNVGKADGDGGTHANADVAATALAMLAFVGHGYDHKDGRYAPTLRRSAAWMRSVQSEEGAFGGAGEESLIHDHAMAATAMCELYAMSDDQTIKAIADRAITYLVKQQNKDGGWGRKTGQKSNTQSTLWCGIALKTARMSQLDGDFTEAQDGINRWLDSVSGKVRGVTRTGYSKAGEAVPRVAAARKWAAHPEMDAANILLRIYSGKEGWNLKNEVVTGQAKLIAADAPQWKEHQVDFSYWFTGTLTIFQLGNPHAKGWMETTQAALLAGQRGFRQQDADTTAQTLAEHGSWDAVDANHAMGGRLWSTTMALLTLQTVARYDRLHRD